jgi:hypothetical protein
MTERNRETGADPDRRPEPGASGSPGDDWRERAAQLPPTEHFTLQSARSITVSDSSSRANLYLSSVSISLVALGLVAQASGLERAMHTFGLVLFPTLVFLGLAMFARVTQSAAEDLLYARGINRIRHFYLETAPQAAPYVILSPHDDAAGVMHNMAIRPSPWQRFLTTAGTIGVVNSVVGAVATGIALDVARLPFAVVLSAAVAAFVAGVVVHYRAEGTEFTKASGGLEVRFPSPPGAAGDATADDVAAAARA